MRFKEFLKEDSFGGMLDGKMIKESFELIKRDCQPYLQQNKSPIWLTPLFRGMDQTRGQASAGDDVFKKQVRLDNRQTTDIPEAISDAMNNWMTTEFGEPFRNALFVSGNENMANNYGRIYLVFPIGNFTFLYHDKFKDIYSTFSSFRWTYGEKEERMVRAKAMATREDFQKKFIEHIASVNNGNWKQDNLEQAINSKNEIMIRTKEYYAVNYAAVRMISTYTELDGMDQIQTELLG